MPILYGDSCYLLNPGYTVLDETWMNKRPITFHIINSLMVLSAFISFFLSAGLIEQNHYLLHSLSQTHCEETHIHSTNDSSKSSSLFASCSLQRLLAVSTHRLLVSLEILDLVLPFDSKTHYFTQVQNSLSSLVSDPHRARGPPA